MTIKSSRGEFIQKIKFKVDSKTALSMRKNKTNIYPVVYFTLVKNSLKLIGVSVKYKNKHFLAKLTDKTYKYNTNIKFKSEKLDLKKLNIDYKIVSKDIQPPSWFYNLTNGDKIIGYGMGDSEQEAKNFALKEIAQSLEVNIKAESLSTKKSDGSNFSSKSSQKVKISTKNKKLKGTKTIKSQKKDGVWFIAVSY
jgi:hypothetical protein